MQLALYTQKWTAQLAF